MKYRRFGKLDWEVSALGFGAMRLPAMENDNTSIDETEAIRMIRHAIDHGVNYVDTAYGYHMGKSEILVGRALEDGYREKTKLATKLPPGAVKTGEDFDRIFNEQLEKLQTDHLDFYLLHGLNKKSWPKLRDLNIIEWAEKAIADGRFQHLGFSFHDDFEAFKEIVDDYDKWTFCQIQYNYMDEEFQAGTKGLQYAAENGLAVVVMEPVRGGQLAKDPPESVKRLLDDAPEGAAVKRTPAEWAFQWIWHHPEVSLTLSGMSTMQQVVENLESADRSGINHLSPDEVSLIARVGEAYRKLSPTNCTNCRYCMPCPNGVQIPAILANYNDAVMYDDPKTPRFRYRQIPPDRQADQCDECLQCEEVCPQEIPVSVWMKKAHEWLGPKK